MASEKIEFLSAVLLTSPDAARLADFYRDVVGLPLEEERHGDTLPHWGCELGDLHFAIHPLQNFKDQTHGTGAVRLAFTVFDMAAFVAKVEASGHSLDYAPVDRGFALMTAVTDPDGNHIEFTQLSDGWFKYVEKKRQLGGDVISRWQAQSHKART
jgi:catechol-2,3-dioxygenase